MKKGGFTKHTKFIVVSFLSLLILSIPPVFSLDLNLVYDENGNLITGDGKFREYNEFNQLVRVREGNDSSGDILEEYLYHPTEDRVLAKKVYNMSVSVYPEEVDIYVNDNFVRNLTNLKADTRYNDTYYVKDENGLVGEVLIDYGTKLFYHNDHLGSTSLITTESGDLVEETSYEPFGAILETYYDPLGGMFKGGEVSRYYYEGKEFSSRTGEYDFHFRKYNPGLMIFTQPDAGINNVYDPQNLNRYAFERNNPYKYVDENGKNPLLVYSFFIVGLAAADFYWITTPIDTSNPQWGERLGTGLLHGLNAGTMTVLALSGQITLAGGSLRFAAEITAKGILTNALAEASGTINDNLIDKTKIDSSNLAVNIILSILTMKLGEKMAGQYIPTKNYGITKQIVKSQYNYFLQSTVSQAAKYVINSLQNYYTYNQNKYGTPTVTEGGGIIWNSGGISSGGNIITTNTGVTLNASPGIQTKLREAGLL